MESGIDHQAAETAAVIADCIEPALLQIRREGRASIDQQFAAMRDLLRAEIARAVAEAVARLPVPRDGKDGRDGRDGTNGKNGRFGPVRAFVQGGAYEAGSFVTHRGGLWQALEDTGQPPPDLAWRLLASGLHSVSGSVDAEDGRLFTLSLEFSNGDVTHLEHRIAFPIHRGTWERGRQYEEADEVAWLGSSWRAIRATSTEPPGADWRLVAKQGERGRRGERGGVPIAEPRAEVRRR